MMMPDETQAAVDWALQQVVGDGDEATPVVADGVVNRHALVDTVRRYFDDHKIDCRPMSAADLDPYLP